MAEGLGSQNPGAGIIDRVFESVIQPGVQFGVQLGTSKLLGPEVPVPRAPEIFRVRNRSTVPAQAASGDILGLSPTAWLVIGGLVLVILMTR